MLASHSTRFRNRLLATKQTAIARRQPHHHPRSGLRHEHTPYFIENCRARIRHIRPSGHPTKPEIRIETVQIRHSRQQPECVFPHIKVQSALPEFNDRRTQRRMR